MLDQTDPLELLSQDALIPVQFFHGATSLGPSMDPGSTSRDLEQGAQVSIPLWMVKPLHQRNMIQLKLPAVYSERYRRKLNAGAECVSFKNLSPYFYEVGNRMNEFLGDIELASFLSRTFRTRYQELVSKGLNTMTGEDVLKLSSKLCTEEQQLFEGGRISIMNVDAWWVGESAALPQKKTSLASTLFKRAASDVVRSTDQDASNKQPRR